MSTLTRQQAFSQIKKAQSFSELLPILSPLLGSSRLDWGDDEAYIRNAAWVWFNTALIVASPPQTHFEEYDSSKN